MSGYPGSSTSFRDGQIDWRQLLRFFPIQKGTVLFESTNGPNVGYGVGDKLRLAQCKTNSEPPWCNDQTLTL